MSEVIEIVAYYSVRSLGILCLLSITIGLWSWALNAFYRTIKASGYVFEYILYRDKFKKFLKSQKPNKIRPVAKPTIKRGESNE